MVVDGDAIPVGRSRPVIAIQRRRVAIEGNRFEQQVAVRSALYIDGQVVPRIALGVAWDPARHPFLRLIRPGVPLISTVNAAFVAPDIGLTTDKLVDVELKCLRVAGVSYPEVNVIGEVVQRRHQGLAEIGKPLRREIADQMVVPEYICPLDHAAAIVSPGGNTVHRR